MSKEDLKQTLDRLRGDVSNLTFKDPASAERVERLMASLERQLTNTATASDRDSLLEDLPSTLAQLEVEHPNLTAALSRVITTLSSMGI